MRNLPLPYSFLMQAARAWNGELGQLSHPQSILFFFWHGPFGPYIPPTSSKPT